MERFERLQGNKSKSTASSVVMTLEQRVECLQRKRPWSAASRAVETPGERGECLKINSSETSEK